MDRASKAVDYRIACRELMVQYGSELARLDSSIRAELGESYSVESWTPASFTLELPEKFRVSTIALCDQQLAGFCIASRKKDAVHIHRAGVHPEFRSSGVATRLVRYTEDHARDSGASRITCHMAKGNTPARSILEGMGYRVAKSVGNRLLIEGAL